MAVNSMLMENKIQITTKAPLGYKIDEWLFIEYEYCLKHGRQSFSKATYRCTHSAFKYFVTDSLGKMVEQQVLVHMLSRSLSLHCFICL